ncbi:MAG: methylmalonyl Co-A mutase-associated GTPase MeaB [Desulfosalsimonadaceae bacterium]
MVERDPKYYIDGVLAGNRKILSKTITLIESALPRHKGITDEIMGGLLPHSGNAIRLGISGVPGVGKSTFIESMGVSLLEKGHRVATLAVDPSSAKSGGSILGDKTRMEKLSADPRAYIRPSPAGKTLGGVARKTRETIMVCEAAGFDVVMVETVGVGQSEYSVASMVDFFLVLLLSGGGDELQGIKRGILEIADALAVNKADGDNVAQAEKARQVYENALHFMGSPDASWHPPVLTCSALTMDGMDDIWETVCAHNREMKKNGRFERKRKQQAKDWFLYLLDEGVKEWFYQLPEVAASLPEIQKQVESGSTTAMTGARQILELLEQNGSGRRRRN